MGARFVRLGIAGFKSFAEHASLEILPGLTGVVGPNGCGKSNVAEALRWAMGEANVRHLRGGEMDDVIFAGTAHRPSRNLAEVSLHIERDDIGLPPPFAAHSELQVVRRIERGGGSVYRVNGREARARDVQTLFADLGSGARASAMVSQGRVGMLVNARPEERRAVLEEAAGITGLHARRAEAETRLRAAETNLGRAEERRAQLETQLTSLQAQARQAARYRMVSDAALEAEATLLAVQLARAVDALASATDAVAQGTEAVRQAEQSAHSASTEAEAALASLPAIREAEVRAGSHMERARLSTEGIAAEAERAQTALAAAQQRQQQLARDLAHALDVVQDAEGADARLVQEAARLGLEADAYPAAHDAAVAEAAAASVVLQEVDATATMTAARAAEVSAQTQVLRHALEQAESRARRARDAHARLEVERSRAKAHLVDPTRLAAAEAAAEASRQAVADATAIFGQAEAARADAMPAAARARAAFAEADVGCRKLLAEAGALAELLAVQDGERWPPLIDRLTVPAGLEAALGAALGDELAAADNTSAPRHWRVMPGCPPVMDGGLLNQVKAPALLARALGAIGLVGSSSEGDAAQPSLQPGQSLVSSDGGVWRWDGYTVRPGTPSTAAVRLKQRNRLTGLRASLAEAERAVVATRVGRDAADQTERHATAGEQLARAARQAAEAARERENAQSRMLQAQAGAAVERLRTFEDQVEQLAPELAASLEALERARVAAAESPDPAALRIAADQARAAVIAARSRDTTGQRTLDGLRRGDNARTARLSGIRREREDRRLRVADLVGRVVDLEARVAETGVELERLAAAPARAGADTARARQAQLDAERGYQAAVAKRIAAEQRAGEVTARDRGAALAVAASRERLVRAQAMHEGAEASVAAVQARAGERVGALPPLPQTPDITPAAEDRARHRLQRFTRERDEIGLVNLRAEIEAGTIESEMETIVRDRDDLATAIAKLRGSIGHLNSEGRERLTAVFQQIDRHFQSLFGRMFGGGRAHLALVGSDDPLLAGLEIYAQPPGKKLTALSLLSGGEQAITALSLIFAVFRCNPAPLCVLDEVDAPLDDANVDRLCNLLFDMVQETGTRFLVVTHHHLTMARMDRLYGVTMQERGVSRLLSVDLSDAVGIVEAVAAE